MRAITPTRRSRRIPKPNWNRWTCSKSWLAERRFQPFCYRRRKSLFQPSELTSVGAPSLTRRKLVSLMGGGLAAALASKTARPADAPPADITLRIQDITLDLGPRHSVKTIGYNGQVPGPLLRAKEGKPVTVEVFNETNEDELVHWHGLHIPSEVDGAHEEGTPHVPRRGSRRYEFTPRPAGTRW